MSNNYLEGIFWLVGVASLGCVAISAVRVSPKENVYRSKVLEHLERIRLYLADVACDIADLAEYRSFSASEHLEIEEEDT